MSLTAEILEPGAAYYDEGRRRLVTLPHTHYAVRCFACPYVVHLPARFGRDFAEQRRRDHLLSAHLSAVIDGDVELSAIPATFEPSSSGSVVPPAPSPPAVRTVVPTSRSG